MNFSLIILTIILSITSTTLVSCLVQRVIVTQDRLYYFHSLKETFVSSLALCRSKGMRLAIPRSLDEDRDISNYAMDGPPGSCHDSPWLGGIFKGDKDDLNVTWLTSPVASEKSGLGTSTEIGSKSKSDVGMGRIQEEVSSSQPGDLDAKESTYQNEEIDQRRGVCKSKGGGKDAVRQAKSLDCKDGSDHLIWWRYPKDNINCKSTTICEFKIKGLNERNILDTLSNTSTLLDEFLERTDNKKITLTSLATMNDFLERQLVTMDATESFYKKITSKEKSRMAIDKKTGLMNIFFTIAGFLAPIIILVMVGHFWFLKSPQTTNECPTSQDRNVGRRLPPIPPRVGPEELYEEIDTYRDYLALSSLDDQYLPMDQQQLDQQKKRVHQGKDSTATEPSNSYVF